MQISNRERSGSGNRLDQSHILWRKGVQGGVTDQDTTPMAAAPAGEGEAHLLREREWDTHASMQGRRDLPQELVNKHPSLQNPDTQLPTTATTLKAEALPGAVIDTSVPPEGNTMQSSSHRIARGNSSSSSSSSSSSGTSSPEASPRPSGALPPLPPITGDMKTSDRAVATGSSLGSSQHSSLQSQMQSSTTPSGIMSSSTGATTRAGPPNLARVSISQMSHEALDRTVPGGYLLVTHLGKECATCTSGNTAGHVLTHEQEQLVARAADLEAEQRQHVAAADEAARIAAAAAARAAELEHEIKTEITERKTLLVQQEETVRLELSRLEARRRELMGRVGTLQSQLAALVEEEEGLLRQQLEAESSRGQLESQRTTLTTTVRDIESLRERLLGDVGRAEARLSTQRAAVEEAEAAVQEALRRLREAEARKVEAEAAVLEARQTVESVMGEVSSVERDMETQTGELNGILAALPSALSRLEQLRAQQRELRSRAEALESEASGVRSEEEGALERQAQLHQESQTLEQSLHELTVRAHTLSCQAAAAAAKAAGARGLQAGEEARARASAAEAEGLRAAASALADADATSSAALMVTSTSSSTSRSTPTMSSHTHATHGMTSDSSSLHSSHRDMPGVSGGTSAEMAAGTFRSTPAATATTAHGLTAESSSRCMPGTGLDIAGGSVSTVPAATTATGVPCASGMATETSSYQTSSGPVPGAGADFAGGSSRAIPAAAAVTPTEGLMVGAIEHPEGTVEGQGMSLGAAAVGLVGAGAAGVLGSVAAARAADLNVGRGGTSTSTTTTTMPWAGSDIAAGSVSTTPAATETATTVPRSTGMTSESSSSYQTHSGPIPGAGADLPGGSAGAIPAAATVAPTDGMMLGVARHGGGFTGGQGVSLGEAAAVGAAGLAGAGDTGNVMPARAADLNVGRGILSTAETGATEGTAVKLGSLKSAGSSSSSSSSGEEAERDTLTHRDQAPVEFGADVHKALDTPMPTPASLVPPSETISAPVSAMSAAGLGATSAGGVSYGPGVIVSNSADVEAMGMQAMLPTASGSGADLMAGSGVQPVSQRTSDWQQRQQQEVRMESSERVASSGAAATVSSRSSGRVGGGLIASIKGMLGVGQAAEEAEVTRSTPTETTTTTTGAFAPTTTTTETRFAPESGLSPNRVPSRSIDISSSSSGASSPAASGTLPDSALGGTAAASVPPADSTKAIGSDLPQSVRPPPVGPRGEESDMGVLGTGLMGAAGTAGLGAAGMGLGAGTGLMSGTAAAEEAGSGYGYERLGTQEQHSNMQQLLQEGGEAPAYVPEAAAARTAAPEAPLEPLGSPMSRAGDEPMTPQPTPMTGVSSDNRATFEAGSIAAIASEAADDAMQQQQYEQQQEQQQPLLENVEDSSFHSPTSSAYQTPATAFSLASSTRDSEVFATPAGSLAAGGLSARTSIDGAGSSSARVNPPAAATGGLPGGPMSMGTEGVGEAANTRLVTPPLYNAGAAADSSSSIGKHTEGVTSGVSSSSTGIGAEGIAFDSLRDSSRETDQGVGMGTGSSTAAPAATAAGGMRVYVGEPGLAAGFDGVPAGTSMEGAVEAANELADEVEADRREKLTGVLASDDELRSTSDEDLPGKAFYDLSRPAGLVSGMPVSPHKQHHEQLGFGGAFADSAAEGVHTSAPMHSTLATLSASGTSGSPRTTGILGGGPMATESSDVTAGRDSSSGTASPRSGGMRAAVKDLINKPKEMIQERRAERRSSETARDPAPTLGRRSYKDAVETNLSDTTPTTTATDTTTATPSTAGTFPLAANPNDTPSGISSGTGMTAGPAGGYSSSGMKGMGMSEVEEVGGGPVGAPAGPMSPVAAKAAESPKKRGFFGSLKKALGTSSKSASYEA